MFKNKWEDKTREKRKHTRERESCNEFIILDINI